LHANVHALAQPGRDPAERTSCMARKVSESRTVMTEMVLPQHTNALGSIFGGVIMSWIDICGAITAQRHSRLPVVTASIDYLQFVKPVMLGWTVNLKASVNYVGKTSMEVGVRVDAENPRTGETFHTASAYLSFVALDQNKKPVTVDALTLESQDEHRRNNDAKARREARLGLRGR
jgi:acyl-CoA hydrolase